MSTRVTTRRSVVVLLTMLACLLSMASVVTIWARNQVLDTDRYLASVTPLATDPVIQDEVARKVSGAISSRLDTTALAREFLPPRAGVLAAPLGGAVDDFIERTTADFVHSDAFVTLWTEINRTGHTELVRVLRGEQPEAVVLEAGRLGLDLSPIAEAVRDRLAQAGLSVVSRLPPITLVVDVASAEGIERAQVVVRRLNLWAILLPVLATTALLGAVALTRRRWTSAAAVLVTAAWSMVVLRALLAVGDRLAAAQVPSGVASTKAVYAYYAHLTSLLQQGSTVVGVVLALVAAGLVVGPGVMALRRGVRRTDERRSAILLALVLACLVLLAWPGPGPTVVVLVLVAMVAAVVAARALMAPDGVEDSPVPAQPAAG